MVPSLGPHELAPKRHLDRFSTHTRVTSTQTDRQATLRATSVATGRIYALHVCDVV